MNNDSLPQEINENVVLDVNEALIEEEGRITSITVGPNQIFTGNPSGDIRVYSRANGERQSRRWRESGYPIEGIMYDHENRVIFATERNLVILDKAMTRKIKEFRSKDPLRIFFLTEALTHSTGRRMIPTLDHEHVFWWGERNCLSKINLNNLSVTNFPMFTGTSNARLISYEYMVILNQLLYIINEKDQYRLIHQYDMFNNKLIGTWMYENERCKLQI